MEQKLGIVVGSKFGHDRVNILYLSIALNNQNACLIHWLIFKAVRWIFS